MTEARVDGERAVRRAVATSLAGKAGELVTLVLLATVVPRALGPTAYGRFAVPLTIVTLGSLALTLGGHTVMARYVPAAAPEERVALARALGARLARGRAAQLAVVVAAGGAASVAAPGTFPPGTTTVVLVSLVLSVATTLALQLTLGLGRAAPWSLRYPLQNAVLVVAALVLYERSGDDGAVLAILVSVVVAAAFAAVAAAPVLRARVEPVPLPDGALRFGVHLAAGAALVQVAQRGSVVVVAVVTGSPDEAAFAALATGIALGVTYAVLQASTVALPHLAGDGERGEAVLGRLTGGLLGLTLVAGVPVALALDPLVEAVFGPGYGGAVGAFGPALGLVVLAPVHALLVQVAALRLTPEAALAGGVALATGFVVTAAAAVPALEAAGGTLAVLVGTVVGVLVLHRRLPGAADPRLVAASVLGAAAVTALAAW